MKKFMRLVISVKTFGAMIFSGLICAYMLSGWLYAFVRQDEFNYTVPFIFIIQGLALSVVTAILWEILLGEHFIKKLRYFPRLIAFSLSLVILLAACLLTFVPLPTDWAKLWLIVAGLVAAGLVVLSVLGELYYKTTGKKYTELLERYKAGVNK